MSSEKTKKKRAAKQARPPKPAQAKRSNRVSSIARSISWGYWWRRLLTYILLDFLLAAVFAFAFMMRANATLPSGMRPRYPYEMPGASWYLGPEYDDVEDLSSWRYVVVSADGETYAFEMGDYLVGGAAAAAVLGVFELGSLLSIFGETRRVRRKLRPLNNLALTAEAMGATAAVDPMSQANADSIATLEEAIRAASVDSPSVSTGNADLGSIEVALNGLLRQMQEAKLQQMRFVSDASHELRTPIAVIQGYINMLDRWGKDDPQVLDESIEALKNESEHMQELVEQLLFLARGDSGRNHLNKQRLNLAALVEEVWEESEMIDPAHTYVLGLGAADAESRDFEVIGDAALVKQLMRIITTNAAKYSPDGRPITLRVCAESGRAGFIVQDEGIGMSQDDAVHAFDRFYRADAGRDSGAEGSGLGLAIAKWIVDAHNGSIDVVSHEGVGTRFTVWLPK